MPLDNKSHLERGIVANLVKPAAPSHVDTSRNQKRIDDYILKCRIWFQKHPNATSLPKHLKPFNRTNQGYKNGVLERLRQLREGGLLSRIFGDRDADRYKVSYGIADTDDNGNIIGLKEPIPLPDAGTAVTSAWRKHKHGPLSILPLDESIDRNLSNGATVDNAIPLSTRSPHAVSSALDSYTDLYNQWEKYQQDIQNNIDDELEISCTIFPGEQPAQTFQEFKARTRRYRRQNTMSIKPMKKVLTAKQQEDRDRLLQETAELFDIDDAPF